jgi:hypothetical protein
MQSHTIRKTVSCLEHSHFHAKEKNFHFTFPPFEVKNFPIQYFSFLLFPSHLKCSPSRQQEEMSFNPWSCCLHWCDNKQQERMGATISSDMAQGGAQSVRERERRKKVTGFATLRKKLISRRRRSSKHDHGRVLREFVSNWSPVELFSLLEEYEALSALKDLSMQAELARPPATTFKQDLSTLYDCKLCTDCDLVFRGNIFPVHRALLSGN